ncbi:MAG: GAF domain-containing protein [Myxococcota bacterium]|nr:GAF domain-containing protein [Myxococcota bacterium]
MPVYELLIPAREEGQKNKIGKVKGDTWMGALKVGLAKLGDSTDVSSLLCDVRNDGSLAVTDPKSGRVFRIREMGANITPESQAQAETETLQGRQEEARPIEDILGELFSKVQDIYTCSSLQDASQFILQLAVESIPVESGAVLIADINEADLSFLSASGPKAEEIMDFRIPIGEGIAGFCAQEGVALAVSDVSRDERFFAELTESVGYEVQSLLCTPAQRTGRTYGVLELVNKRSGSSFSVEDLNVLAFLAHEYTSYLINTGQTGD